MDYGKLGFEPAVMHARQPKILVFGRAGSGKTRFALGAGTKEQPALVMDSEGGTHFYTEAQGFYYLRRDTQNIVDAMRVVDALMEEDGPGAPVVLDSGTVFWTVSQDAYCARAGIEDPQFGDWRKIKHPFQRLYSRLMILNRPIIITAHESAVYSERTNKKGRKELFVDGYKFDFEKKADHVFDIILRMMAEGGKFWAEVYKTRLAALPTGTRIDDPSYAKVIKMAGVYDHAGKGKIADYDRTVQAAADTFTNNPLRDDVLCDIKDAATVERIKEIFEQYKDVAKAEGWLQDMRVAAIEAQGKMSPEQRTGGGASE